MYGGHKNPKVHPFEVHKQHRIYGGQTPRYSRIHAHQDLRERGELIRWIDLSYDAHIIFFSHEWVGWSHPEPQGVQLKTFLDVMEKLHSGKISRVEMTLFHTLMYKQNQVTTSETWKEMLETAYVWIDWSSMPQPSACPPSVDKKVKEEYGTNLGKAVKSIPAYVHTSLILSILAYAHKRSSTDT